MIDQQVFVPSAKMRPNLPLVNKEDVACFAESTGKVEVKTGGSGIGTSFIMNTYYAGTSTPHPGGISGPMGIHLNNTLAAGDYCIYSRSNIGCRDTFVLPSISHSPSLLWRSIKQILPAQGLGSIQPTFRWRTYTITTNGAMMPQPRC